MAKPDTYSLLPAQHALLANQENRHGFFLGGLGGGKTHGLCWKGLSLAERNAPHPGIMVQPTFRMLADVMFREMVKILDANRIEYKWRASDYMFSVNTSNGWADILLRSADRPERLQAINAAWAVVDESAQIKREAAQAIRNRVRIKDAQCLQIIFGGTPDSMSGFFYDWSEGTDALPDSFIIRAKTADNPHVDPGYLTSITASMSEEEKRAWTEGYFTPPAGRVYHRFNRDKHVRQCLNRWEGRLILGADFNVGRMCWILGREIGTEIHWFHEFDVADTDTQTMCHVVRDYLAQHGRSPADVRVHCDASGAARRTSAPRSDIGWLQQFGFRVEAPAANPAVRDRVAAGNAKLAEHPELGAVLWDPSCTFSIRCVEAQGRDKKGEPDKANGLDHMNDAWTYAVWFRYRAFAPKGNSRKYT